MVKNIHENDTAEKRNHLRRGKPVEAFRGEDGVRKANSPDEQPDEQTDDSKGALLLEGTLNTPRNYWLERCTLQPERTHKSVRINRCSLLKGKHERR